MDQPEFPRPIDIRAIDTRIRHLEADETERQALATRFGLIAIDRLEAQVELTLDGTTANATGTLEADIIQICAISGDALPARIRERLTLRFVPDSGTTGFDEEIELEESELDEIPFDGRIFDLGEAIAQSLVLAIDPYATGPNAEQARKDSGLMDEDAAGPFAALAALKKKD